MPGSNNTKLKIRGILIPTAATPKVATVTLLSIVACSLYSSARFVPFTSPEINTAPSINSVNNLPVSILLTRINVLPDVDMPDIRLLKYFILSLLVTRYFNSSWYDLNSGKSISCTMFTCRLLSTPISCNSCALIPPTTGPMLANIGSDSNASLGTVPVKPQRIGALHKLIVSRFFNTSALAMCTSSTITVLTPSRNSANVRAFSKSQFLLFLSRTLRLCHVHIVCVRPKSLRSP